MYRTLLVPLDGSPFAEHALPYALTVARRGSAKIRLVSVVTPLAEAYVEGLYFSTTDLERQLVGQQQSYLDRIRTRLLEHAQIDVAAEVLHGEVAATLNRLIDQGGIDLVIMATHGRGALGRFWLGSVADEMLRHVTVPMLLVRPGEEAVDLAHEPNLGSAVVALDGSPLAEQILGPTLALAGLMPNASLTLMRAIHSVVPVTGTPDIAEGEKKARHLMQAVQQMQSNLTTEANAYLDGVAAKVRERGLAVQTEIIVEDQPATAILKEADKTKAGLVAIATHARGGLSRMILGSTADKVIRSATFRFWYTIPNRSNPPEREMLRFAQPRMKVRGEA